MMMATVRNIIALSSICSFVVVLATAQPTTRWQALGSGLYSPVPLIYSIVPMGENLYVGGVFFRAGGMDISMIARWNWTDRRWYALGAGVDGNVHAILPIVRDGDTLLVVGGIFENAGDNPCQSLAAWNTRTQQWECFASNISGGLQVVFSLYRDGDDLYVCGSFDSIENVAASGLAKYNLRTRSWQGLGRFEQLDDSLFGGPAIDAVVKVGESLYAIGGFTHVDGKRAVGIARYDLQTQQWDSVPGAHFKVSSADDAVLANAIARVGDTLVVGGQFDRFGQIEARCLLVYDTRQQRWSSLGGGVWRDTATSQVKYYAVFSMNLDEQRRRLYVGGSFDQAGTIPAQNIAVYDFDQNKWDTLESGVNGRVTTISNDGHRLYVGGGFTNAGTANVRVNYIASWIIDTTTTSVALPIRKTATLVVSGHAIRYSIETPTTVRLSLFDLGGRQVAIICDRWHEAGTYSVQLPELPTGMYFLRLNNGERITTLPLLVQP
jgi:hypothetical protein